MRKTLATTLVAAAAGAGALAVAPTATAMPIPIPLTKVDQACVLVQAQVEPRAGDRDGIRCSTNPDANVRVVQIALRAKGYATATDGWYGYGTTAAYVKWQKHLGYSGAGANGLPGYTSLSKLGTGRFTITHPVTLGRKDLKYTSTQSGVLSQRTYNMLAAADRLLGTGTQIRVIQGSYHSGVGASGGTHDGGGAVDVSVSGKSSTQIWQTVRALRTVGFAAWYRPAIPGVWSAHIHGIAIADPDVQVSTARDQVADYYMGRNGLASHAADNTPTAYRVPFTWWERYRGI